MWIFERRAFWVKNSKYNGPEAGMCCYNRRPEYQQNRLSGRGELKTGEEAVNPNPAACDWSLELLFFPLNEVVSEWGLLSKGIE